MPEGDMIFRAARTLNAALAGKKVVRFESVLPKLNRVADDSPIVGRTIERVWSIGKHLIIGFSGDLMLRTHLRMNGSWHIYRTGERWKRSRHDMRVLIATDDFVAVGFRLPVAEFLKARDLDRHRDLRRIGPDLSSEDFDESEAVARLKQRRAKTVADALLDQGALAGIGNIYKSETLFLSGVNPFRKVSDVDDEELQSIVRIARKLLVANAGLSSRGGITTRGGNPNEPLWVYGRAGKACFKCRTAIAMKKQGADARVTFWCPRCQNVGERE